MTQVIIYKNDTGGVSVVYHTGELSLEAVLAKDIPAGAEYEVVEQSEIPTDRTFRNAWVKSGKAIATDLPKAKETAHNIRRAERAKEFQPLDIEATIPAKAQEAENKRQLVRDNYAQMQADIDSAETPEEIKTVLGL